MTVLIGVLYRIAVSYEELVHFYDFFSLYDVYILMALKWPLVCRCGTKKLLTCFLLHIVDSVLINLLFSCICVLISPIDISICILGLLVKKLLYML